MPSIFTTGHDAADDRRKLHQTRGLQILGLQRHVGRAEVDGLRLDLRDAAAGADRLVVHADPGLLLVGVGPFRVDRIRERGAGACDVDGDCALHAECQRGSGEEAFHRRSAVHVH